MRAGIFSDEDLDLQWIQVRSNVTTSALIAGEIDVSASAGSAMRVAARGAAIKAIFFPYYKCTFVLMGARRTSKVYRTSREKSSATMPPAAPPNWPPTWFWRVTD